MFRLTQFPTKRCFRATKNAVRFSRTLATVPLSVPIKWQRLEDLPSKVASTACALTSEGFCVISQKNAYFYKDDSWTQSPFPKIKRKMTQVAGQINNVISLNPDQMFVLESSKTQMQSTLIALYDVVENTTTVLHESKPNIPPEASQVPFTKVYACKKLFGSKAWIFGEGYYESTVMSSVDSIGVAYFDLVTKKPFQRLSSLPNGPKDKRNVAVIADVKNNRVILLSSADDNELVGYNSTGTFHVHVFDIATQTFEPIATENKAEPRTNFSASLVTVDGRQKIVVYGGYSMAVLRELVDDVDVLDLESWTWQKGEAPDDDDVPDERFTCAMEPVASNSLIIAGGKRPNSVLKDSWLMTLGEE